MKHIDVNAIRSNPDARLRFLAEFVGFEASDREAIRSSLEVLEPALPALLDALYEHLLSWDDTRRIFIGARGEVDPRYLAVRKEHLTEWMLKTVESGDPADFAQYMTRIAKAHTGVVGEPQRMVPPRYMVALISYLQTAITEALLKSAPQGTSASVARMVTAWNKMLMLQLELFLKVIAPHWPQWDEA